jgi:predicted anti-sigma-YlaC factor YlaD
MNNKIYYIIIFFCLFIFTGCSIKSIALNSIGDALSGESSVFTSDNDPDLIKDALPFALKLHESILEGVPDHKGLILATSKAFCMYSYAFVQIESERVDKEDYEKAKYLRHRAYLLYLRARDYALRGLELNHRGFSELIRKDLKSAIAMTNKEDVPLLYWCGASWVAALTVAKDNVELIAEMPIGVAMVNRVLELDESFDDGSAHEFFISYEGSRSEAMGGSEKKAREHFKRAVELSKGEKVGPYLSLATSVCLMKQDVNEFKNLLNQALSIDVNKNPKYRLSNIIMQRRAKWLLDNINDYFLNE